MEQIVHPSQSPRFFRNDKLDIQDIKGTQPNVNSNVKNSQTRDANLNVLDISNEHRRFKVTQITDKNKELLTDEILGKKKVYDLSFSNPMAPTYIMSTNSNRRVLYGEVEDSHPKQLIKREVNKDTKRYMRIDDITGTSPRERDLIPENMLPSIHPKFQDRELQKEILFDLRKDFRRRNQ